MGGELSAEPNNPDPDPDDDVPDDDADLPDFPVHLLRPTGGSMTAMLWGNEYRPPALRWECLIEFAPVPYDPDGRPVETNIIISDFEPRVRHWHDLVGYQFYDEEPSAAKGATGSFYKYMHLEARRVLFEVLGRDGTNFTVRAGVRVYLNSGPDPYDPPPPSDVDIVAVVPFEFVVVDSRVMGGRKTSAGAVAVLERFIEPAGFESPVFERFPDKSGDGFWKFVPRR